MLIPELLNNVTLIFLLKIFLRHNSETVYLSIKVYVHSYKDIPEIFSNKNGTILSVLFFFMSKNKKPKSTKGINRVELQVIPLVLCTHMLKLKEKWVLGGGKTGQLEVQKWRSRKRYKVEEARKEDQSSEGWDDPCTVLAFLLKAKRRNWSLYVHEAEETRNSLMQRWSLV